MLALPPEALRGTREFARAPLLVPFAAGLEEEIARCLAEWHAPESQAELHALTARLGKA
jgi:hypothetical protein